MAVFLISVAGEGSSRRMGTWILASVAVLFGYSRYLPAQQREPVYDGQTRLEWHRQHLQMRDQSPYKDLVWSHIGPQLMSGRVTDIAKPLDQPFTFYVATASGGLWKTINQGTTWRPIFDDAPSGSVGAVAVDPNHSDIVWVGLGESNILRSSMAGTGVYKSIDGGQTWQHQGLADTQHIGRIVVDPSNSETIYVATCGHEYTENEERGVYRSRDGGTTWERVLYVDSLTGAIDLAIDPQQPDVLYAAMWRRIRRPWSDPLPGPGNGIYKSVDGGDHWEQLRNGLPADEESIGRIGLSLCQASSNVLYAIIDSHQLIRTADEGEKDAYGRERVEVVQGAVIYRSDDHGESWRRVSEESREMQRLFGTYGWVFGQVRVDPTDANTVYAMGVSLLKSVDGGQHFQTLVGRSLHADHHALWIDPANPQFLIDGNDGGLNLSYDGGESWQDLENLPVVQFYNVALDDATPFNVYGSIQDNGSWRGPSNHRPGRNEQINWRRVPGGEAGYMQVDPADNNIFYSESFYGRLMRSDLASGRSETIMPQAGEGEAPVRGQWLAPFLLSKHNSAIVYHGLQSVFRSMDRGKTWQRLSGDLTYNDPDKRGNIPFATITTIHESPLRFGLLYVGTDDGRVHVTKNSGERWDEIITGLPARKWVSRVMASNFDEATVYLTLNGKRDNDFQCYVYRSANFGEGWVDIGAGIPGGPVNVILEDPFSPDVLYVGTDMGVYVSTDFGTSWAVLGSGLPITFVHDMAIHVREKKLVIATHGRGMHTLEIANLPRELEKEKDR